MALSKIARLFETGQYLAASHAFLAALQDPEVSSPRDLAELYFLGASIRHKLGHWHSALELARIAERHAIAAGEPVILGKLWFNLVQYLRATGDVSEAQEYATKFLDNLGMYPELDRYTGACHYNLALCLRQRNLMDDCLRHYRTAAEQIEKANNPRMAIMVYQNLAWHLLEMNRVDEAQVEAAKADLLLDDDTLQGRRQQLLVQAFWHYKAGHLETCRQMCEEFLVPGAEVSEEQRFWSLWMCGMMYSSINRTDLAQTLWLLANDCALKTGEPRLLNYAGQLRSTFLQRT